MHEEERGWAQGRLQTEATEWGFFHSNTKTTTGRHWVSIIILICKRDHHHHHHYTDSGTGEGEMSVKSACGFSHFNVTIFSEYSDFICGRLRDVVRRGS